MIGIIRAKGIPQKVGELDGVGVGGDGVVGTGGEHAANRQQQLDTLFFAYLPIVGNRWAVIE